jgi:hypothetical protein
LFQGITSFLAEANFFVRLGVNLLVRRQDTQPVQKISVYDYLWQNSDTFLQVVSKVAPSMLPIDNVGLLEMVSLVDSLT